MPIETFSSCQTSSTTGSFGSLRSVPSRVFEKVGINFEFIDDYSKMAFAYFPKCKSEVGVVFENTEPYTP